MANHEVVYGICENKCQHEVYKKEAADEQFLSKSSASNSYAIKNHSSSKTDYGIATKSLYGHVQLTDALNIPVQVTSGIALAASAGKELNDKIVSLQNTIANQKTFGLVKLSNSPISQYAGGASEYAFSAIGADVLRTQIDGLLSQIKDLEERVTVLEHEVGS